MKLIFEGKEYKAEWRDVFFGSDKKLVLFDPTGKKIYNKKYSMWAYIMNNDAYLYRDILSNINHSSSDFYDGEDVINLDNL